MSHFFGFVKVQKLKLSAHEPAKEGAADLIVHALRPQGAEHGLLEKEGMGE